MKHQFRQVFQRPEPKELAGTTGKVIRYRSLEQAKLSAIGYDQKRCHNPYDHIDYHRYVVTQRVARILSPFKMVNDVYIPQQAVYDRGNSDQHGPSTEELHSPRINRVERVAYYSRTGRHGNGLIQKSRAVVSEHCP